jgi:dihydrolipoamide dehydrogenase
MHLTVMSLSAAVANGAAAYRYDTIQPVARLRFCGLRRKAHRLHSPRYSRHLVAARRSVVVAATAGNGAAASGTFDYDLVIIGAGVGGHGAALHAVEKVGSAQAVLQVTLGVCNNVWWLPLSSLSGQMYIERWWRQLSKLACTFFISRG